MVVTSEHNSSGNWVLSEKQLTKTQSIVLEDADKKSDMAICISLGEFWVESVDCLCGGHNMCAYEDESGNKAPHFTPHKTQLRNR